MPPLPNAIHRHVYSRYHDKKAFPQPQRYGITGQQRKVSNDADWSCWEYSRNKEETKEQNQSGIEGKAADDAETLVSGSIRELHTTTIAGSSNLKPAEEKSESEPILIFFHGNGDPHYRLKCISEILQRKDTTILFPDYRGHSLIQPEIQMDTLGVSENSKNSSVSRKDIRPNERVLTQDMHHMLLMLPIWYPNRPWAVYGISQGSGVAMNFLESASQAGLLHNVTGLILDSPFASLAHAASFLASKQKGCIGRIPKGLTRMISSCLLKVYDEQYNNVRKMQRLRHGGDGVKFPVLLFAALQDDITDPRDCDILREAAGRLATVISLDTAHGSCMDSGEIYYKHLIGFLDQCEKSLHSSSQ